MSARWFTESSSSRSARMIRTRVAEIRETGRNAQGVRVMNVEADERVVAIEPVGESDDDETAADGEAPEASAAPSAEPSNGAAESSGDDGAADGEAADSGADGGGGEDEPN